MNTRLAPFSSVAALWDGANQRPEFSVETFLARPGVLVLGFNPILSGVTTTFNDLLLQAIARSISAEPDVSRTSSPRHWFVFDELVAMGCIESVCHLLSAGHRKGVSVLVGAQTIPGLCARYGERLVSDLLSQSGHKCFLHLDDMESARWATQILGGAAEALIEWRGDQGELYSIRRDAGPCLSPELFLSLPTVSRSGLFVSVSETPGAGPMIISRIPSRHMLDWRKPSVLVGPDPEDTRSMTLADWSEEEDRFFCGGLP